jgi:hypothetical protein
VLMQINDPAASVIFHWQEHKAYDTCKTANANIHSWQCHIFSTFWNFNINMNIKMLVQTEQMDTWVKLNNKEL